MQQPRNEKGQFEKGGKAWNEGLKNVTNSRPNSTSFKGGESHPRHKPIGSERIDKDGLIVIKVAEKKWMPKHRHLWERRNGTVPRGYIVIFANGDKRDFSEENLLLVSRAQLMSLNKNKLIKNDGNMTKTGLLVANLLLEIGQVDKKRERG